MEVRISPEPSDREGIVAAVEALLASNGEPPAYRSAWRELGIRENLGEEPEDE